VTVIEGREMVDHVQHEMVERRDWRKELEDVNKDTGKDVATPSLLSKVMWLLAIA